MGSSFEAATGKRPVSKDQILKQGNRLEPVTLIHAVKVESLPMGSSAGATAEEWSASGAEIPGQGRKVSRHDTIQVLRTQKNYFVS